MNLDVALSLAELAKLDLTGRFAVVIDVLRATTTITSALTNGAAAVIPRARLKGCRAMRMIEPNLLLGGERGGRRPTDFNLGNSPREYTAERIAGRRIAFSTTNGTRALAGCHDARAVWIAAFTNCAAVARTLSRVGRNTTLVCAGKLRLANMEDTACAGAIVDSLHAAGVALSDRARIAWAVYDQHRSNIKTMLRGSSHGRKLIDLGLGADIDLCANLDSCPTVGRYLDGEITLTN